MVNDGGLYSSTSRLRLDLNNTGRGGPHMAPQAQRRVRNFCLEPHGDTGDHPVQRAGRRRQCVSLPLTFSVLTRS